MFYCEPMFTHSAQMAYLLRNKRNEIMWYNTQFILQNIYKNLHLTHDEMITKILTKEPSKRNLFDIRYLLNHISSNNFFKKLKQEGNFDLTFQCLKELKHQIFEPGEKIIKYGEGKGDPLAKFYVIVKGKVDVYIPVMVKIVLSLPELARLILEYKDMLVEVNGQKNFSVPFIPYNERQIFKETKLKDVLNKIEEQPIIEDKEKVLLDDQYSSQTSKAQYRIAMKIGQNKNFMISQKLKDQTTESHEIIITYLKKTAVLTEGQSFGEVALLLSKDRTATIIASKRCDCAVLEKTRFLDIMGKIHEIQINKKLEILRSIPMFNLYSKAFKVKILNFMEILQMGKGEVLYHEQDPIDSVYLIVSGEFKSTKKFMHYESNGIYEVLDRDHSESELYALTLEVDGNTINTEALSLRLLT